MALKRLVNISLEDQDYNIRGTKNSSQNHIPLDVLTKLFVLKMFAYFSCTIVIFFKNQIILSQID